MLPLTVEPTKPRLCHVDLHTPPFKSDYVSELPRHALPGHFQTVFDDKNGGNSRRYQPQRFIPDCFGWPYSLFADGSPSYRIYGYGLRYPSSALLLAATTSTVSGPVSNRQESERLSPSVSIFSRFRLSTFAIRLAYVSVGVVIVLCLCVPCAVMWILLGTCTSQSQSCP